MSRRQSNSAAPVPVVSFTELSPAQRFSGPDAGPPGISRRRFAAAVAGVAAGTLVVNRAASGDDETAAAESASPVTGPVVLAENRSLDLYRVRLAIEVKGNVDVPIDPLASRKSHAKLPITSDAVFDYEERYHRPSGADLESPVTGVERFFHEAASEGTLNKTAQSFALRPEMCHTLVRRDTLPEVIYSPDAYFSHEELGLLRAPVCSVGLGDLLPAAAAAVGDEYQVDRTAIRSLLNLSTADGGEVSCRIESIDDDVAKISLKGKIDGSVEGVPTLIRLIGKLTFDRRQNACTWLALAVHETREIGKAVPGFDVSATIRMIRQPMAQPVGLPAASVAMDLTRPVDPARLLIELKSGSVQVATLMDRRWWMITDRPGNAMMRMIDHEVSLGQCNIKPLVRLPEGKAWTMSQFEQDVKKSLGKQLTRMIRSDSHVSPGGVRTMQLTAAGNVEGVDVRWIVQHLAHKSGRRVLATFTTEAENFSEIAGSEVQFAETLEFLKQATPTEAAPPRPAEAAGENDMTGTSGRGDAATRVANRPAPANKTAPRSVKSASDLR